MSKDSEIEIATKMPEGREQGAKEMAKALPQLKRFLPDHVTLFLQY